MSRKMSKIAVMGGTLALLATTLSIPVAVLADNFWVGKERTYTCRIPEAPKDFQCKYGPFKPQGKGRQIGGFYVNPMYETSDIGRMKLLYRVNGGEWMDAYVIMNQTSGNYIDFGEGVREFEFRFPYEVRHRFGTGANRFKFTMNYDLDR